MKTIGMLGLSRTGRAVAEYCERKGLPWRGYDRVTALPEKLWPKGESFRHGEVRLGHAPNAVEADIWIVSPGIPPTNEWIVSLRTAGAVLHSDLDFFQIQMPDARCIAITGTNGKSTVTTLTREMLEASGITAIAAGNLGNPPIADAGRESAKTWFVIEVSSFQMYYSSVFRPKVAVCLNVTPDHLDWHTSIEEYAAAKAKVYTQLEPFGIAVYSADDERVENMVGSLPTEISKYAVSTEREVAQGAFWRKKDLILRLDDVEQSIEAPAFALKGKHNRFNIAASLLAAWGAGAKIEPALTAAAKYKPLSHRVEDITVVANVRYVDDSKGTNVDAMVQAILAMESPVILIAGGIDKGGDWEGALSSIRPHLKHVILIGSASERIERAWGASVPTVRAASMADAVTKAHGMAHKGDVVLLSPGCSSFDMYNNYAERGNDFAARARSLETQ